MAILHRKEEKIQVVLGRLPKQYGHEQFIEMFIKLYSKDWGKIKSAYIKQSQDKEPGTVVNMPKPELYLKQLLETYLANRPVEAAPVAAEEATVKKSKTTAKNTLEEAPVKAVKAKAAPKKKAEPVAAEEAPVKKAKATAKKTVEEAAPVKEVKAKAVPKKKTTEEKAAPAKAKKA